MLPVENTWQTRTEPAWRVEVGRAENERRLAELLGATGAPAPIPGGSAPAAPTPAAPAPGSGVPAADLGQADDKLASLLADKKKH